MKFFVSGQFSNFSTCINERRHWSLLMLAGPCWALLGGHGYHAGWKIFAQFFGRA
jgi:hypothetical protein